MATIDPNQVASDGVAHIQSAIDKLNTLKLDPNADFPAIDAKIHALEEKQTDLLDQTLKQIEDSPENHAAIAQMNAAAAALKRAADEMTADATALNQAAAVVSAAAGLITSLAPFI
jgi:2',3'-cyclic-nucleotide 2'-phosphodiesterase (5'-nucleotidase family)